MTLSAPELLFHWHSTNKASEAAAAAAAEKGGGGSDTIFKASEISVGEGSGIGSGSGSAGADAEAAAAGGMAGIVFHSLDSTQAGAVESTPAFGEPILQKMLGLALAVRAELAVYVRVVVLVGAVGAACGVVEWS
jgi:hypothetical protein